MNRTKATLVLCSLWLALLWPADRLLAFRDLETGTFLTRDPAGTVDGPNLYTYVRQNPWTHFDPEGLETAAVSRWALHPETMPDTQTSGQVMAGTIEVAGAVSSIPIKLLGVVLLGGSTPMGQQQYQRMLDPKAPDEIIMQRTQAALGFVDAFNSLGVPEAGGRPEIKTPQVPPFEKVRSPSEDARKSVQGSYVDPLTNQVVPTNSTVAADHIVSQKEIKALAGFEHLTPAQQDAVLNNPANLQGLPKTFNSSKQDKTASQWSTYKGQPLSQDYIDRSKQLEQSARQILQKQIQESLKQNESNK